MLVVKLGYLVSSSKGSPCILTKTVPILGPGSTPSTNITFPHFSLTYKYYFPSLLPSTGAAGSSSVTGVSATTGSSTLVILTELQQGNTVRDMGSYNIGIESLRYTDI